MRGWNRHGLGVVSGKRELGERGGGEGDGRRIRRGHLPMFREDGSRVGGRGERVEQAWVGSSKWEERARGEGRRGGRREEDKERPPANVQRRFVLVSPVWCW